MRVVMKVEATASCWVVSWEHLMAAWRVVHWAERRVEQKVY